MEGRDLSRERKEGRRVKAEREYGGGRGRRAKSNREEVEKGEGLRRAGLGKEMNIRGGMGKDTVDVTPKIQGQ